MKSLKIIQALDKIFVISGHNLRSMAWDENAERGESAPIIFLKIKAHAIILKAIFKELGENGCEQPYSGCLPVSCTVFPA